MRSYLRAHVSHVKKARNYGNSMSESLRTMSKIDAGKWSPNLKVSIKTEEVAKKIEELQHDLEHKAKLDEATRHTSKYESNLLKACAESWERCSKSMKSKIEAHVDYESGTRSNRIKLSQTMKERSLSY